MLAYASIGRVPGFYVVLAVAGLGVALWTGLPDGRTYLLPGKLGSVIVVGHFILTIYRISLGMLTAQGIGEFLVVCLVTKLLCRRANQDYLWIILVSVCLLLASLTLSRRFIVSTSILSLIHI